MEALTAKAGRLQPRRLSEIAVLGKSAYWAARCLGRYLRRSHPPYGARRCTGQRSKVPPLGRPQLQQTGQQNHRRRLPLGQVVITCRIALLPVDTIVVPARTRGRAASPGPHFALELMNGAGALLGVARPPCRCRRPWRGSGFPPARFVASSAPAHPKKVRVGTETTTRLNARYRELAGGRRRAARAKAHRNHTVRPVRGVGVDGSHCGALRLAREAEKDLRGRKFALTNVKSMIDGPVTCNKMPMDGWGEPKRCPAFPRNCSTSFSSRCSGELYLRHWSPEGLPITVLLLSAPWPYALFDLFAGAFALWIQGGVIPVLVWAFLRFRRRSANTVLMCWAAVIAVLGFKDLYAVWFAFWVPTLR